ncbi:MAG: tRNA (adenosine(37)-N6)-threonylcarbamoyltransferase complex dimerization subunit type 1 TsaB, partial [Clostridiales bacterium]|nr:tRNA (adenosine(37)-N6)-threonylcarbamoyltransferase complex dimerization subunit type 1 TsaB [Clostridiales bacterium]
MKILALDTSAKAASVALCEVEKLLALDTLNIGLTHSETMLPMIESLLSSSKTDISDIDLFACSAGPGSFTGLRIGVSVIKGLAFGKNKICVGVSTLEALARNISFADDNALVCPVMDARRNQVFCALFRIESGKPVRLLPDDTKDASELASMLGKTGKNVYFVGDGYDMMKKMNLPFALETPEILRYQNGYSVAMTALDRYNAVPDKADFTDLLLSPEYLRPS